MKLNYLFPNKYKKIGWLILIPSAIIGLITLILEFEPNYLDFNVLAFFIDEFFGDKHFIGIVTNNVLNEILGVIVAGFLGWLLTKSILETKGLFWAWLIHFLQDVIIFSALLTIK